jgi:hypothetical protein
LPNCDGDVIGSGRSCGQPFDKRTVIPRAGTYTLQLRFARRSRLIEEERMFEQLTGDWSLFGIHLETLDNERAQ